MHAIALTAFVVTSASGASAVQPRSATASAVGSTAIAEPTETPVLKRIDYAVAEKCPEARAKLSRAELDSANPIPAWSDYVRIVEICGRRQHGVTQARLYAEAASEILESILYLRPDAYGSASWRKKAADLLQAALPEASSDPELVSDLRWLQNDLRQYSSRAATSVDIKPMAASIALNRLRPAGAISSGSMNSGRKRMEIWFAFDSTLDEAEARLRAHLVTRGWYFCPPPNPKAPHDEVIIKVVGPTPTPDPHVPRKADRELYASLGNQWDMTALLFKRLGRTDVTLFPTQVDMAPLCVSPKRGTAQK